jgi:hypothetical protein
LKTESISATIKKNASSIYQIKNVSQKNEKVSSDFSLKKENEKLLFEAYSELSN